MLLNVRLFIISLYGSDYLCIHWCNICILWVLFFLVFFNTHLYCSVGCLSMIVWTHAVLGVLYACVLHFSICTCSEQLSMFHMERHSRNTLNIIIIITKQMNHTLIPSVHLYTVYLKQGQVSLTTVPVSILSLTMQLPLMRTASHCIRQPRRGISMMSPGTRSSEEMSS